MSDMTREKATELRKPFPRESVGQLPKGGVMLDYVGHAAVTDRLLTVDPEWSWEPVATDPNTGMPMLDFENNLWIKLTICGVTRYGVGDGKSMKERVGDAIRNAAMRFGVALDLWAKENLVEFAHAARSAERREQYDEHGVRTEPQPEPEPASEPRPLQAKTRARMFALFGEHGIPDADQLPGINHILGTSYASRKDLTEDDAQAVIAVLASRPKPRTEAPA